MTTLKVNWVFKSNLTDATHANLFEFLPLITSLCMHLYAVTDAHITHHRLYQDEQEWSSPNNSTCKVPAPLPSLAQKEKTLESCRQRCLWCGNS